MGVGGGTRGCRTHVYAGLYVLEPRELRAVARCERCEVPTLLHRLWHGGERTIAYPMHEPWLDVGRRDDFERAQALALPLNAEQ